MKLIRAWATVFLTLIWPQFANAERGVELVPKWNVGDIKYVTLTEEHEWKATGNAAKVISPKTRSIKQFKLEVLSKDKDGYVLKWELLSYLLGGVDEKAEPMKPAPEALYFYKSPLKVRINLQGEYVKLENDDEIAKETRAKWIDQASRGPSNKPREEIEKLVDKMLAKMKELGDSTTATEIRLLLCTMGLDFGAQPQTTEQKMKLLGFAETQVKTIRKLDGAVRDGVATVTTNTTPANEKAAKSAVKAMTTDYRQPLSDEKDLTEAEYLEETAAEVDVATGWPKKINYTRQTMMGDAGGTITTKSTQILIVDSRPPETTP